MLHIGLDVGSTTVKIAVLDDENNAVYKNYQRHYSDIKKTIAEVLGGCLETIDEKNVTVAVTGSGGIAVELWSGGSDALHDTGGAGSDALLGVVAVAAPPHALVDHVATPVAGVVQELAAVGDVGQRPAPFRPVAAHRDPGTVPGEQYVGEIGETAVGHEDICLLYTSPSPRDTR